MRQLRLSVVYISGYITIEDENVCFNSISLHKENVFAFLLIFNLIRSHRCFFIKSVFTNAYLNHLSKQLLFLIVAYLYNLVVM